MDDSGNKLALELATMGRRLLQIAAEFGGETVPVEYSKSVMLRVKRRQCLVCGDIAPSGKTWKRGLCGKHYQQAMRDIAANPALERAMVMEGAIGPHGKSGRKKDVTKLDKIKADASLKIIPKMIEEGLVVSREHAREQEPNKPQ